MQKHFQKIFILLVFVLQQVVPVFETRADFKKETSLVVVPIHDGSADEASDKTAAVLHSKLSETTPLHVVAAQKVDAVLSYHRNFNLASPDSELEKAKDLLKRAREHYFTFAYGEAEAELGRIGEIFKGNAQYLDEEGGVLLDSLVTLAMVHAAGRKKGEALEDFKKVLTLHPLYQLDPKGFAPSIQKLFAEARESFDQSAGGTLEVTTDPKVAEVYLNGIYQGVAPLFLTPLPPGEYRITLKANNYETVHKTVLLVAGNNIKVSGRLRWENADKSKSKTNLESVQSSRHQIEEGTRTADLLKVDKVLLVNVDNATIVLRLVDRKYRAGHNPIVIERSENSEQLEKNLDQTARFILAQTELDLLKNPTAHLDPDGVGSPILLGRPRKKISKGLLFGGLGVVGLAGLVAGILAATAGGDNAGTKTGSLSLSFK
ncbi:MAG: PEGA domain-containing protein [Deltaproteobacteria bacterium]|nr:PEGA domain-containing protein [Deltaproteobacteria bacterium]